MGHVPHMAPIARREARDETRTPFSQLRLWPRECLRQWIIHRAPCRDDLRSIVRDGWSYIVTSGMQWGARVASSANGAQHGASVVVSSSHRQRRADLGTCLQTGYHRLDRLIWKGTEEEALLRGAPTEQLTPPWKITLLSDGSVTRHLQLMTGQQVRVDCLEMKDIGPFSADMIPCTCDIPGLDEGYATVRRQVFLDMKDSIERPYVYAVSFWHKEVVDEYLKDKQLPIWASLSAERTELYRDIVEVQLGYCDALEDHFGCPGPFWARTYVFWHNKKPLTIIYEVFSNKLHTYLGPSCWLDA
jgi:chorismate--pyruvate lyase